MSAIKDIVSESYEDGRERGRRDTIKDVLEIINDISPAPWEASEWCKNRRDTCDLIYKRVKALQEEK